jgi:hypothetical protein
MLASLNQFRMRLLNPKMIVHLKWKHGVRACFRTIEQGITHG